MQIDGKGNMSSSKSTTREFPPKESAKTVSTKKIISNESSHSHQITYKIKDGLYLATSLDAFKDDQFILLNWIQHIVVFQNQMLPFDNRLKGMYGQEHDEMVEENQEIIRYLHFGNGMFYQQDLQGFAEQEDISDSELDQSLIKDLHHLSDENKLESSFNTIFHFIEDSHSLGSSCLIMPSNPNDNINDLSCVFSICTAYLMTKYKWSLYKALQFMNSRIKDVNLSVNTYEWLNKVQIQLLQQFTLTYNWDSYQSNEELVLRNTLLNSKKIVCDNTLRKLEMNGQKTSRQKLKSKPKFQNPSKKPNLTNRTFQKSSLELKPILKQTDCPQTLRTQRKRLEINTELNQVKQYEISTQQFDHENIQASSLEQDQQFETQKSFQSSKSSNFLTVSRNKRISLCVSKIVSKYKEQRNLSQKNNSKSKGINFDELHEANAKQMTKKKSVYNFESFRNLTNQQNKSNQGQQISKILKKIKMKQNIDTKNDEKITQIISNTEPSICHFIQNEDERTKLNTQSEQDINSTKRQSKKSPKNDMIRKNSLNTRQPTIQPSQSINFRKQTQAIKCRSQQKLRQLKPQNILKSHSKTKLDQKKQNLTDKLNGSTCVYIKEVKTQKSSDRKQLMNENIDNTQKNKQKPLMIEYEDFKEMIKKKQKSICNLVSNHTNEDKILKEKQTNYLSSVIQKLKKDVSEIQSGMNQGNIMKKTQQNCNQKLSSTKIPTLKWR